MAAAIDLISTNLPALHARERDFACQPSTLDFAFSMMFLNDRLCGVKGIRQDIKNESCCGRICVARESNRRFAIVDGLARLEIVFCKARLNTGGFFMSDFTKDQKIISKEEGD